MENKNEKFFELTLPEAKKKKSRQVVPDSSKSALIRGRHNGDRFQMSLLTDRAKDIVIMSDNVHLKVFSAVQRKYGKFLKGVKKSMFCGVNAMRKFAGKFHFRQSRPVADLVISGIEIDAEKRTAEVKCYLHFYFGSTCMASDSGTFLRSVFEFANQSSFSEADFIGTRWMLSVTLSGLNCPTQVHVKKGDAYGFLTSHFYVTVYEMSRLHLLSAKERSDEKIILEPALGHECMFPIPLRLSEAEYEKFILKYSVCN